MPKLSHYGALVQGALIVHVGPRLAADAKLPDFRGILSGAPMTNRISQRAHIAQAVQTVTKPHLAADADLDDVSDLLEAIEKLGGEQGMEDGEDGMEANSAIPMVDPDPDEEEGLDNSGAAMKIKAICEKHQLPPEVCAELAEAVGEEEHAEGGLDFWDKRALDGESEEKREKREDEEGAADARKRMGRDESEEEREERKGEDAARHAMRRARDARRKMGKDVKAEDRKKADDAVRAARDGYRKARDARMRRAEDRRKAEDAKKAGDMVTKKEAEDMVKRAVGAQRAEDQKIAEAREFVRPWVGDIKMACDSAEQVHREALRMLGDAEAAKVHASALPAIISRTPKPGEVGNHPSYALDAAMPAGIKPASERFAGIGRVTTI